MHGKLYLNFFTFEIRIFKWPLMEKTTKTKAADLKKLNNFVITERREYDLILLEQFTLSMIVHRGYHVEGDDGHMETPHPFCRPDGPPSTCLPLTTYSSFQEHACSQQPSWCWCSDAARSAAGQVAASANSNRRACSTNDHYIHGVQRTTTGFRRRPCIIHGTVYGVTYV